MALVKAGQLDAATANLLKMALGAAPDERTGEAALRIIERRIGAKMLAYFRLLANRVADDVGAPDGA